ncbi:MAG: alpha/beta hydrolase [Clostridia bacterium]|nr:alpha/beta hydrolase [Clostridia bacterium]
MWTIIGSVLGAVAFLVVLVFAGFGIGFYGMIVKPKNGLEGKSEEEYTDYEKAVVRAEKVLRAMPNEPVKVVTHDGLTLRGNFIRAEGESKITILCLHGYTSNGYAEFSEKAQDYLKEGWNVLLVNHRNHGPSEGKYVGFATLDRIDALLWLKEIERLVPGGVIFITGVSMGGATAMQTANLALPSSVKGIIEDCGFTTCREEFLWRARTVVKCTPKWAIEILGLYIKVFAGYGLEDSSSLIACKEAKVPMMFIHGNADDVVPVEMAYECYNACTTEKELVIVEGCKHARAHYHAREQYMNAVKGFIAKHK